MAHIAAYVTGHGFGHATRVAAIVGALAERVSDLQVTIVSTVPEWLFRLNLTAPFSYRVRALDVGVVQQDSIRLHAKATLEAYAALLEGQAALVEDEAAALRRLHGTDRVVWVGCLQCNTIAIVVANVGVRASEHRGQVLKSSQ